MTKNRSRFVLRMKGFRVWSVTTTRGRDSGLSILPPRERPAEGRQRGERAARTRRRFRRAVEFGLAGPAGRIGREWRTFSTEPRF